MTPRRRVPVKCPFRTHFETAFVGMDLLELLGVDLCKAIIGRCEQEDAVKSMLLSKDWRTLVGSQLRKVAPSHPIRSVEALRSLGRFVNACREGVTIVRLDASHLETSALLETLDSMGPHLRKLQKMTLHMGTCSPSALQRISRSLGAAADLKRLAICCTGFLSAPCDSEIVPTENLAKVKKLVFTLPREGPPCFVDCLAAFPTVEFCTVAVSPVTHVAIRSSRLQRLRVTSECPLSEMVPNVVFVDVPQITDLGVAVEGGTLHFENECSIETMRLWSNVRVTGHVATVRHLQIERGVKLFGMSLTGLHVREVIINTEATEMGWDSILFQLGSPGTRLVLGTAFFTSRQCFFDSGRITREHGFAFEHVTAHLCGIPESDVLGVLTAIDFRCPVLVVCHFDRVDEEMLLMSRRKKSPVFLACPKCEARVRRQVDPWF